ncbi:hypothetical protein SAMD00019534_044300 [Acytostelium subglobosum LB1]|uniref:hypothetical protein n=1 Tax=Acytostelium subglobosum LB1 TaxID=1410327 RepID=UPI000644D8EA|nr:hypothetical protein SAMD00019534_044300 [Acytostelium subglobosum LB1]GAM21255.1 hypothetical protein SAMD00019534_044300 [Acytostelium subglobosum LB1]|eukprot:XP_012755374.1 hypothetical protein SAMD00019534_044300 [Acytostelium subglobosum LB1]
MIEEEEEDSADLYTSANPLLVGVGYDQHERQQDSEANTGGAILTADDLNADNSDDDGNGGIRRQPKLSSRRRPLQEQQTLLTPPTDSYNKDDNDNDNHNDDQDRHHQQMRDKLLTLQQLQNKKYSSSAHHGTTHGDTHINNNLTSQLSSSSQIFTTIPLHSPMGSAFNPTSDDDGGPSPQVFVHPQHSSQVNDKYLSLMGASHNQVFRKKQAALNLKSGRRWLLKIILLQSVGNLIRALPIFILEKYYVMLVIFFQAFFLLIGSYGTKKLKKYLVLLYAIGCFGTTILDLIITFTYAHSQNHQPFNERQIAFWTYALFVALLCCLNIIGGIYLGLRLFVSLHTLEDRSSNTLVLLAASLVGSFESSEDDDQNSGVKANRTVIFYGADVEKAINVTKSITVTLPIVQMIKDAYRKAVDSLPAVGARLQPTSSVPADYQANLHHFSSNEVITSKYNVVTFLPKVIFFQFSRLANLYTLCIVILCMFSFSPVGPISSVTPLLVVISVSCFKELAEDIKRHRQDREINNRSCLVYRPPAIEGTNGTFETIAWKDIKVGDVINVKNGDMLPADIICFSTSRPDGRTYLETANLDGETNLKLKTNVSKTNWIKSPADLDRFACKVDYEGPNNDIYGFEGVLTILKGMEHVTLGVSSMIGQTNYVPITIESLLLRGTKLRNTDWVIGIVTYTGLDTKVERNSTKSSQKRSSVERGVNNKLMLLFFLQTIICIICSIGHNRWHLDDEDQFTAWYLGQPQKDFIYVSYIILYNTLIPLSMYVSMEVIRMTNALFIDSDMEMYDEKTDTPAQTRNTNINEELGQVQYLFSDKTGTLTCNEMVFNRCTIGGTIYGPDADITMRLNSDLNHDDPSSPRSTYVREYLTCLAVCNTVVIDKTKEGADLNYNPKLHPKYQAASPDEEALVIAAAKFGFVLKSREDNIATISVHGREERYEVLNVLEFNSYRKRMSVIVRTESGQIRLYCKGADSMIMDRSERVSPFQSIDIHKVTEAHIGQFASNGLRTLCMSMAILDPEYYLQWNRKFEEASVSLVRRAEMMDQAAELIEKNMVLLGASGIEDRLQDHVPETIQSLREAGIKVWVLTGDKQETAISIATASSVIHNGMELIVLNENTKEDLLKRLLQLVNQNRIESFNDSRRWGPNILGKMASALNLDPSDAPLILNRTGDMQVQMAIVIDGSTLTLALDKDLRYHFLQVAKTCESVVCCRCSPSQKAKVVKLIAERSFLFGDGAITMAIGDGANDVPMILKAHIGVGISGREGMQAVLASDFAIANFHMLRRLLLVHGNRSYKRITKLILYSFSKNVALSISQFWFGFFSAFSGQMIYFDFLFTLYNALFTSLPVLSLGTFDQDVKEEDLLSQPHHYRTCQANKPFSMSTFIYWIFLGMWQSGVIFFVTFFVLQSSTMEGGKTLGLWSIGTAAYLYLILTTNIQVSAITSYWTIQNVATVIFSVVGSILFVVLYSLVYWVEPQAQDIIFELFTVPAFWLLYIIVPAISFLPYAIVTINGWMFSKRGEDYYSQKEGFIQLEDIKK